MLIRVMYRDRTYDMVREFYLEGLIAAGRISRFRRDEGWVEIGRGRVRGSGTRPYTGPERREPVVHRPLETPIRIGGKVYIPFPAGRVSPD